MCTLKELHDGTYDLAAVALMVDILRVKSDNEAILNEIQAGELEAEKRRRQRRG